MLPSLTTSRAASQSEREINDQSTDEQTKVAPEKDDAMPHDDQTSPGIGRSRR